MCQTNRGEAPLHEDAPSDQRLLRTLLEESPSEVVRYDHSLRRTYLNGAHARAMGSRADELVGMCLDEPALPTRREEIERLSAGLERVLEEGAETTVEFQRPSGNALRYYRARLVPEPADDGTVENVVTIVRDITESRRAEDEIRRAHSLIEGITEGTQDMIAAEDHDFRYLYFNEAYKREFRKLWGQEPEVGTSMLEAMAPWPAEQEKARELWSRALAGESFTVTTEFGPSGEETQIYELRFNPVHDTAGTCIGAAHIFRNVTERVRTAEALRESQERYRLVNLSTHDVLWDWDLITDAVEWDGSVESVFGVSREELGPHVSGWTDRIHADDHERVVGSIHRAIDGASDWWTEEYRFQCADDEWKTFLDRGHIARRDDGTPYRMIGSMQDITGRKAVEDALAHAYAQARTERDRLQAVLEILPVSVFIADANGRIIMMNKTVEAIWGQTSHTSSPDDYERDYKAWWVETGERVRSEDWAIARALTSGQTSIAEEIEIETALGDHRFILNYALPIHDEEGEIAGAVALNVDIDELKKTEEALAKAKEQAEHANRAKSEFLAHMSHEIRTPISGIIGMVEVLISRARDPEQREQFELVRDAARSLLSLLGDILDLSRIESETVEIERTEWEIAPSVETISAPFGIAAEKKGLSFDVRIADDVPDYVRADGEKIAQVLRNLISNAVKYTKEGSVTLDVSAADNPSDRTTRLRFAVQDTGRGIAPAQQAAVFESFTRIRKSVRQRDVKGTGLGLTISKRLTEMMGGDLSLESTPGVGSTFVATFDLEVLDRPGTDARKTHLADVGDLPPLRILVAEDNGINQLFLKTMLEDAGHTVTTVSNGRQAVDSVTTEDGQHFDVILMDVQMPELDGMEATEAIRAGGGEAARVPIVALTAFAMSEDEQRFRAAGMDGYVTKPVEFDTLAREIRRVVLSR